MTLNVCEIRVVKGPFKNYSYLVVDSDSHDAILIDPAWEVDKINYYLSKFGCVLKAIFLTHYHYDHINLASFFSEKYDVPICAARDEMAMINLEDDHSIPLDDDAKHQFGSINAEVFLTPGHTPGSACYRMGKHVFTGDTLFIEGCGTCIEKDSDAELLFTSLQRLKSLLNAGDKIYPGHSYGQKPGVSFDIVSEKNIYLHVMSKENFVKFRMRENQKDIFNFC